MAPKKKTESGSTGEWRNCEAKRILYTDLLAGLIPLEKEAMDARAVFDSYKDEEAFDKVPWKNFPDRLKRLREKVVGKDDRSKRDADALAHDRQIYPEPTHNPRGEPYWQGSQAQKSLEKDIEDGKHLKMRKKDIYKSRPEYQLFHPDVFRGHVYQELKKRKFLAYCKTTKRGKESGRQQLLINQRLEKAKNKNSS